MDAHEQLRGLPIQHVLSSLGVNTEWKPRKGGTEMGGKCPFHKAERNTTSFNFSVTEGTFHCFSCEAKGKGAIDAVMRFRNCGFKEAVEYLQGLAPVAVPKPAPVVVKSSANSPFSATYEKYYVPSQWLQERGFSPETLAKFRVGQYDNPVRLSPYKGKVMLPVRRYADGEVVAYLARNTKPVDGEPKYLWPRNFQKSLELYGSWELKNEAQIPIRVCYLVESPFAVLKFWQVGLHAVSPFGWHVSEEQIRILGQLARGLVYLPDTSKRNDATAVAGTLSRSMWVRMPEMPDGIEDPERLSLEQVRALT